MSNRYPNILQINEITADIDDIIENLIDDRMLGFVIEMVRGRMSKSCLGDEKWKNTVIDLSVNQFIDDIDAVKIIMEAIKNRSKPDNIQPHFSSSEPVVAGKRVIKKKIGSKGNSKMLNLTASTISTDSTVDLRGIPLISSLSFDVSTSQPLDYIQKGTLREENSVITPQKPDSMADNQKISNIMETVQELTVSSSSVPEDEDELVVIEESPTNIFPDKNEVVGNQDRECDSESGYKGMRIDSKDNSSPFASETAGESHDSIEMDARNRESQIKNDSYSDNKVMFSEKIDQKEEDMTLKEVVPENDISAWEKTVEESLHEDSDHHGEFDSNMSDSLKDSSYEQENFEYDDDFSPDCANDTVVSKLTDTFSSLEEPIPKSGKKKVNFSANLTSEQYTRERYSPSEAAELFFSHVDQDRAIRSQWKEQELAELEGLSWEEWIRQRDDDEDIEFPISRYETQGIDTEDYPPHYGDEFEIETADYENEFDDGDDDDEYGF